MEQTVTLSQSQHFFELVNDSIMTRSMEGLINFWNRSAEELYGWRKEEAVGRVSHDLLRTQFPKPLEEIESELVRKGRWEGKLVHTTRDGGRVVVESRWTLELEGQLGVLVEINTRSTDPEARTDETMAERKRSQNLVKQTVPISQPQHIFEFVNDSVMTRSMEGRINFWNGSAEELYGWRKEEAVGRVSHDLLRTQFPKPLEEIESELVRNGRWEGKLVHTTREGGRVVVESRWTLELNGQLGAVVEINARSSDPGARTNTASVQIGRQESVPASKLLKSDDFLAKIARIVLVGGAFLCIFLLSYVSYYYGWTAERRFSGPFGMILYYVFPAVLASLLFGFLRRSPEFKVNAVIVCFSLFVAAYAGDLFLRLSDPGLLGPGNSLLATIEEGSKEEKQKAAILAKQFGVDVEMRNRLEVITDLRKQDIDAVPGMIPGVLLTKQLDGSMKSAIDIHGEEAIPLGGMANKLTVLCNESGQWVTYTSDEHGFRNLQGIWESGHIDVAVLGDSFAQGYCVPSDKNFVAELRKDYPATLNLGMAGNGPLFMMATLREYLPPLKPKVVLWCYFEGNDLTGLQNEKKSALLRRYLNDGFNQGLAGRQKEIDQALADYIQREAVIAANKEAKTSNRVYELLEIATLNTLRKRLGLVYGRTNEEVETLSAVQGANVDLFREILSKAKADVSDWGGTLYFVYQPAWSRYANVPELGVEQRERILAMVKTLGIPTIDIHHAFQSQKDPLSLFPFRKNGHYNENGHQLVAEEILKAISLDEPGRQS
jgi:PAS domain S-box-containing protein